MLAQNKSVDTTPSTVSFHLEIAEPSEIRSTVAPDSYRIFPEEATHLMGLAATITTDPTAEPAAFTDQAARAAHRLPEQLWEVLHLFGLHGSRSGILVPRGLPVRQVPATPCDNKHHVGETTQAARIQAIINSALGEMVGYQAEGGGRLFQDMVPSKSMANTQTSQGSRVILEAHTEQAFSDLRPDFISLMCLRGDPHAATFVFPATDLLQHLTVDEERELRRARWTFEIDESFRIGGHQFAAGDIRGPFPILSGPAEDPDFLLDQDLQHGITKQAQKLLEKVIDLYCQHRRQHILVPGDLLLLDNHRAIHGRSAFEPIYDGYQRFIVRSFVTRDLVKSHHARAVGGRIIAARYS